MSETNEKEPTPSPSPKRIQGPVEIKVAQSIPAKMKEPIPYRQIRAVYDSETITVYQAYSVAIATAAVREQKLCASREFSFERFTWVKPSWCWMMYRSGYALKDSRQTRILALKISHASFRTIVMNAAVCRGLTPFTNEEKNYKNRVQWDPERSPALGVLPYRSIQIGIGRLMSRQFAEEMVLEIEDVTERAARLREAVKGNPDDEDEEVEGGKRRLSAKERAARKEKGKTEKYSVEELIEMGVVPREVEYVVDEEVRKHLKMDGGADS